MLYSASRSIILCCETFSDVVMCDAMQVIGLVVAIWS